MNTSTKPIQIRIRISPSDEETLKTLTSDVLSVTDIASYLLHAATDCVRENPGQVLFPPKFKPAEFRTKPNYQLNERTRK